MLVGGFYFYKGGIGCFYNERICSFYKVGIRYNDGRIYGFYNGEICDFYLGAIIIF